MKITCISHDWQIDVSHKEFTINEENNYFNNEIMMVYTFPAEVPYTIHSFFKSYRSHQNPEYEMKFDIVIELEGKLHQGEFEITDLDEHTFKFSVVYGKENFPNWDKKLEEIDFHQATIPDIRVHALAVNQLRYPEANYYFPLIHTDQFKNGSNWQFFKGSYNLMEGGVFVPNEIDVENNVVYNRNIMKPYMYWLFVLTKIIEDAGYILKGDVLYDSILKRKLLITARKPEKEDRPETVDWEIGQESFTKTTSVFGVPFGTYYYEQEILHHGKFRIKGEIHHTHFNNNGRDHWSTFSVNGVNIWEAHGKGTKQVDIVVTTQPSGSQIIYKGFDRELTNRAVLKIIPIELYDENGNVIDYLTDSNKIDLRNSVPDCTVGKFIETTMKEGNYDINVIGNEVWMNSKEKKLKTTTTFIDWSKFKIGETPRSSNQTDTYLMKYTDVSNEEYKFEELFVSKNGTQTENFVKIESTNEITIDAIPLPITMRNNQQSAFMVVDDANKIMEVLVTDALSSNATDEPFELSMNNIYRRCYAVWLRFMIFSILYSVKFKTNRHKLRNFDIKDSVFFRENSHFIKSCTRVMKDNEIEVDAKTYMIR